MDKSAKLWLVDRTWASSAVLWKGSELTDLNTEQKKKDLLLLCSIYLAILCCLWRENTWQERLQGSVHVYSMLALVFMWLAVISVSVANQPMFYFEPSIRILHKMISWMSRQWTQKLISHLVKGKFLNFWTFLECCCYCWRMYTV